MEFFSETRHAFGRTALLLSGGAGLGLYHYGVFASLYYEGLLPKIISGTSVGSLFAAFICCSKPCDLHKLFKDNAVNFKAFYKKKESFYKKIKRFVKEGVLMDINVLN